MDTNGMSEATQSINRTMIAQSPGAEATLMGATVMCAVCRTENPPGEKYCAECGFLLASVPGESVELVDPAERPRFVETGSQREHFLREGENSVGREACDVLLENPTVSRRHALVVLDGGRCWVEDLGSTNGTSVSGGRLQPNERTEVFDGSDLSFGSADLSLRLPSMSVGQDADDADPETMLDKPVVQGEDDSEMVGLAPGPVSSLAMLVSTKDPDLVFAVMPGVNAIGRRDSNQIVLSGDSYVSGVHAELVAEEGSFCLTDVGSTNGTSVNGTRLQPQTRIDIKNGDEILMGQSTFRFDVNPPAESAEAGE